MVTYPVDPDTCHIMVAEPTLFLSRDELIQVRVHTTKKGVRVYCVRDFIRMIANKQLKPSEALIYWMSAASSRELRSEHDIQDQYAIQFLGPYEPKNMCITAGGLLILFHYARCQSNYGNSGIGNSQFQIPN